jgi:hypothetical protein
MTVLKLCDPSTVATGTIAGGAVHEPYDVRIAALWRHDSVKAKWPREYRASVISEASDMVIRERM